VSARRLLKSSDGVFHDMTIPGWDDGT